MDNSLYDKVDALRLLALQFIWLLRDDVRGDADLSQLQTPEFHRWWLLCGRAEYPCYDFLSDSERESLAELITPCNIEGYTINLPRAIKLLVKFRPDVKRQFTQDGKLDLVAFIGWFFMLGLKEHALEDVVSAELIAILDKPVIKHQISDSGSNQDQSIPSATLLMRLVWHLLDPQMKKSFDLSESKGRERFLVWFFCVAIRLYPIAKLLVSRWRYWLLQDQIINPQLSIRVPRFAIFEHKLRLELKEQFNIELESGVKGLLAWAEQSLTKGGDWSWLTGQEAECVKENLASIPVNKKPFGVNLYGFAYGELGLGEDLRMAVAVCDAAGIPYRVINIDAGKDLRQADKELVNHVDDSVNHPIYAINIFCLPAFDMVSRIFLKMGPSVFKDCYNIGWWPWELSTWPKAWRQVFELVDEVWAGSSFSLATYQKNTLKPCFLMPLAASTSRVKLCSRQYFGLSKLQFLFLYVLDFNSSLNRKNPHALVSAFKRAFDSKDKSVGLVIKIMNVSENDENWIKFKDLCELDPRITIINKTMDREEVLGLINTCDAYVSPHRGEGFGRTLAEAMLFGKPVIATNYSGNVDFMEDAFTFPVDYQLIPLVKGDYYFIDSTDDAVWADPSVNHMSQQMLAAKKFTQNPENIKALKNYAEFAFSVDRIAKTFKTRLSQVKSQLAVKQG